MKHPIFAIMLFISTSLYAHSGSLWCSLSSYGTPTETLSKGATPFALIQVDQSGHHSIQLYIEDFYHSTEDVITADLVKSIGEMISGLEIGQYNGEKEVEIKIENGRIILTLNAVKYFCEIPGNYKTDYSRDIKKSY